MEKSPHPNLDQLMWGYFNEDFDLWGDTIPEIVSKYKEVKIQSVLQATIKEIDEFMSFNPENLDSRFAAEYSPQFVPEPWGHTTISFLNELKHLLSE
jgi:hypothetical protein